MATRFSYIFLGAEVLDPDEDVIPAFLGPSDRNRHDRDGMHFGEMSASVVLIDEALGTLPAGSTLEQALRFLWDFVVLAETGFHRFTLDAETDEDVFWRDKFTRIVLGALGRSTGNPSRFGEFDWQRFDTDGSMDVEVDGDAALFTGVDTDNAAEFIGYPTFTSGELLLEIFIPYESGTNYFFEFQPWRDDVTDTTVRVRVRDIAGNFFFDAQIGEIITSTQTAVEGWHKVRFLLGAPGEAIAIKLWPADDPEPDDWEVEDVLPDVAVGPRWLIVGGAGKTAISDGATSWSLTDLGSDNYQDIAYGPAFGVPTWMVVGSMVGVIWSRDAVAWTTVSTANSPSGTLPNFGTCATDGAGTWIAAAGGTSPATSVWRAIGDPATSFWNRQSTTLANGVYRVRWLNDRFVAITQFGTLATSPDGGTGNWTNRTTGMNPSDDWLDDAMYGNGIYLAHGGGGSGADEFKTLTSPDGATWTLHTIAALQGFFPVAGAYGQGLFVVVGFDGFVASSADGVSWTIHSPGHSNDLTDIAYVDGVWVSVSSTGQLYETTDPTGTWTAQTSSFGATNIASVLGHPMAVSGMPRMTVSNTGDTAFEALSIDNIRTQKTDSDPVRIYHALWLNAEVAGGHTQTFLLNAIARARISSSKTLDAIARASRSSSLLLNGIVKKAVSSSFTLDSYVGGGTVGSFTLDGLVKASRSSSFTLNAESGDIPTGESGELGDHILGTHELGGD